MRNLWEQVKKAFLAEIQKYFRSFFGANENFKICFRDLLTFRSQGFDLSQNKVRIGII